MEEDVPGLIGILLARFTEEKPLRDRQGLLIAVGGEILEVIGFVLFGAELGEPVLGHVQDLPVSSL